MVRKVGYVTLLSFTWWLYAGDVWRALRLQQVSSAAMTALPVLPLAVFGLGVGLLGLLALFVARWRSVFLALAVATIGVDLVVVNSGREPRSVDERCLAAVNALADFATELATPSGVPADVAAFSPVLEVLGSPPFVLDGGIPPTWAVELQRGCSGPVLEAGARSPGTLVYCLSADAHQAWVTAISLDDTFGAPSVPSSGGFVGVVVAPPEQGPAPMWEEDSPDR